MKDKSTAAFFSRVFLLLIVLFGADRLMGSALEYLFYRQNHGDDYTSIYLMQEAREEVIILGGSRASHHYNASLIGDSTGMSCFNGGRNDMNVYYSAAVLPEIYKRTVPKIVVLDIFPTELAAPGDKGRSMERVSAVLMPFSHRHPGLLSTIALADDHSILKMRLSHIYPYNSTIGASIQNGFTPFGHHDVKGYDPISGTIDPKTYKESVWGDLTGKGLRTDSNTCAALTSLIRLTKQHGTRLIVVISPLYFPADFYTSESYLALRRLLNENKVELYDFSHDPRFLQNPAMFYDDIHLNGQAATIFSKSIANIIKNVYLY